MKHPSHLPALLLKAAGSILLILSLLAGTASVRAAAPPLASPDRVAAGETPPWPMFRHDPQRTGRSLFVGPQHASVAWTYLIGSEVNSSPTVGSDGTIYIGAEDGRLYAIDPNGSLVWSLATGGGIYSSPALAGDGTVYVGSRDHNLYAVHPDGTPRWTFPTGGEVNSSPAIAADGTIYVGSYDGSLYAVAPSGALLCSYSAGAPVHSSPAIGPDGAIYVGSANGVVNALNPDCTLRWQSTPPSSNGIWTTPAVSADGGTIYYGADDGYFYATETATGTLLWRSPYTYGGVQSSAAIGSDGTVYVGTQYGYLWALDPDDGSVKWKMEDSYKALEVRSSPAIGADGTIYFATAYGYIFAKDQNGSDKWIHMGDPADLGHFFSSPAIGADGALYVGSTNGKLYAFNHARITATPDASEVYPGDRLSVDLDIQNARGLYAAQLDCAVDPAVLQLQSAAFGEFFDPVNRLVGANQVDPAAGTWLGAISQRSPAGPLRGDGNLAILTYQAGDPGVTSIACVPVIADRDGLDLPVSFTGASITVLPFAIITGVATYQGRLHHAGITVTATGPVTRSALTQSAGDFVLSQLKAGDYDLRADVARYLPGCTTASVTSGQMLTLAGTTLRGGDANDDDVINIGDATLVAANFGQAVPPADSRADINADNTVNIRDLAILGGNYELAGCQDW